MKINSITMDLHAEELIRMALKEDISSEDVSTNSVMPEPVRGTVDLIAKQDGVICGLPVFEKVFMLLGDDTKTVINTYVHYTDDMRSAAAKDIQKIFA